MNARDLIKRNEGLRLVAYLDSRGFKTIGYGHLMLAGEPESITVEQAENLFELDYAQAEQATKELVPNFDFLTEPRKSVLIDMAYNLGKAGLQKFQRMLKAISLGYWSRAAIEILDSAYAEQVGRRANENAILMATGVWI